MEEQDKTQLNFTGESNSGISDVIKCSQCGADMVFDTARGKLVCPYCGFEQVVENQRFESEIDFKSFDESKLAKADGAVVYMCPNCHAETVMHEFGVAEKCPFCGATNIVSSDALPGLKPDCILPFIITKEVASAKSLKWIKKQIFAPSKLKKAFTVKEMSAIYEPSFVFSSDTVSKYDGRLGKTYTVTVGSGKNRHTETRVKWYKVNGTYSRLFEDIVIEASPHLDQKQMDKVGPFDTANAVNYKKEYLAGFIAERHDVGVNQCFVIAKKKMDDAIKREILNRYDADRIDYLNISTRHGRTTFKQLLLPIYSCYYKFKEKLYNYIINGRTGRATGKVPLSPIKVGLAVLVALAAVVSLYLIYTR